ncbi:MAG: TonB-dependent receptor domain-containing protein [Oceanicaulis sp.]
MLKTTLSAAVLAAAFTQPSLSQTDASASDGDVIVVTAVRAPSDAARLPASVSVIDRDAIELTGAATLAEVLKDEPGLSVVQSGPAGSLTSIFIRGANSKHTLALYDGLRLNDPSAATGVFNFGSDTLGDAARVEIVRGPLSSLYGSDAVGGVINILPRQAPEEGVQPFAEASVGERDTYRGLAGLGAGGARARGVVTLERFETGGHNVTPERIATAGSEEDGAAFTTLSANGSLDLNAAISLEALVRLREAESEFDTFSGGSSGFQRADDTDLHLTDDQTLWSLGLAWTARDGALTGRMRGGQVLYDIASFNGGVRTDVYEGERDFIQLTGAWRPQTASLVDPLVSFGVEHQDERIDTDTAFNDPLSVSEGAVSVFAAAQAGFGARLTLTGSARFDEYEAFGGEATGNLGAVFALPELRTRLRASYGTSFKAPTLSERFASSAFVTPNPELDPEAGTMGEIGFDTNLETLAFGAAWYDGEIENLIENVFDFKTFTGTNVNIGRADLSGVEAYGRWTPHADMTVSATYTYTDAVNADTGARLLRRPEHAWSASAEWRPTQKAALSLRYAHTGERLDVTYDDAGFFVASGETVDGFGLVDLSGRYSLSDAVEVFAAATNLLDETYEQPAAFAGAPRTVSIGVRWRPKG